MAARTAALARRRHLAPGSVADERASLGGVRLRQQALGGHVDEMRVAASRPRGRPNATSPSPRAGCRYAGELWPSAADVVPSMRLSICSSTGPWHQKPHTPTCHEPYVPTIARSIASTSKSLKSSSVSGPFSVR